LHIYGIEATRMHLKLKEETTRLITNDCLMSQRGEKDVRLSEVIGFGNSRIRHVFILYRAKDRSRN
jgi:hypothetical protein